MPLFFLIFFFIPLSIFSGTLKLICTNNYIDVKSLDVKDLFIILDSDKKKIELGGLSFFADDINVTDSNISWRADNVKLYPDSYGKVSGIIGRYSGELMLKFRRNDEENQSSLGFRCKPFKIKDRKF